MKWIITILVSAIVTCSQAQTPIELFYGNNFGVLDIRISKPFNDSSRFSIFSKNIFEIEYDGQASFDVLQNLNFNVTKHFGLVSSVRLSDNVTSWRNGIRFVHESHHLFATAQLMFDWSTSANRIAYLAIARYTHPISKSIYFYTQNDLLGGFYATDLSYANTTWRLRVGMGKRKTQGGFAMNQEWLQPLATPSGELPALERRSNYGVFIRHVF